MKILIDSNIIFSAIIKENFLIRKILSLETIEFYMCWFSIIEITKHKEYLLKKSNLNEEKFAQLLGLINQNIEFVENEKLDEKLDEAMNIMQDLDIKDAPILAAALAIHADFIWSNDKHFQMQDLVDALTTEDVIKLLQI